MCRCETQKKIAVPYITRGGDKRSYFACLYCDCTALWPNFTRTSPPLPKE